MRPLALLLALSLGCSPSADDDQDPASSDAGGADGAVAPDAAAPTVNQETTIDSEAATCGQACAALGVGCTGTCDISAGAASYGYFDWEFGFVRIVDTQTLATCDAEIPESVAVDGESYELANLTCCCAIPPVTTVNGDPAAPAACSDVCAGAGHAGCGDFYDWQRGPTNGLALGGVFMEYYRAETGSVGYWIGTCDTKPSLTQTSGSVVRTLRSFACACR